MAILLVAACTSATATSGPAVRSSTTVTPAPASLAVPTAPPVTPVVSASAAVSAVPVVSALASAPSSPTAPPITSVTLRVVHCPATYGGEGTLPAPPPTSHVTLPSDVALDFSFYGVDETLVLAPKGWTCSGEVGADGSYRITVADPSDIHATVLVDGAGADFGYQQSMACPFFPAAAKQERANFPGLLTSGIVTCTVPSGEQVRRIDPTDVEFVDPPGIAGTGALSGLTYRVEGIVRYAGSRASTLSCALPPASASLCTPILDTFMGEPF